MEIGAAKKESENPFYHSSYADLGEVMRVCKKPCNDNGITILQPVDSDENGNYVETILLHGSGEFISSRMRLAVKSENDPQALGSSVSYAKRYSLQAMLLIPSEDDDGERATNHVMPTVVRKEPQELSGPISEPQKKAIFAISKSKGMSEEELKATFHFEHMSELTKQKASEIINGLNKK